jgi:hypothetical protein
VPVTFLRAAEATLQVANARGTVGSSLRAVVQGGSGSGQVVVNVADGTATKCLLKGNLVTAATAGTCRVSVVKDGDRDYLAAGSTTAIFTYLRFNQGPLSLVTARGIVNAALPLVVAGGKGTGSVRFEIRGGSSATCTVNGAKLTSLTVGTCQVVAIKKGDGVYRAVTSALATFHFTNKPIIRASTVSPTRGLTSGSRVRVGGRGFGANRKVLIAQCLVGATSLSMCDTANAKMVVSSAAGNLPPTNVTVVAGLIGPGTCGESAADLSACDIHLSSGAFTNATVTALQFVHVAVRRTLYISPSSNLKNHQVITLWGVGFTPHDTVYYAECLVGTITQARCDLSTYKSVTIGSAGTFPVTTLTVVTGSIGPATCGTGANDRSACEISVANSSLGDAAVAKFKFATHP